MEARDARDDATTALVNALGGQVTALSNSVDTMRVKMDAGDAVLDALVRSHEAEGNLINVLTEGMTNLSGRMDGLTEKVGGLTNDIAEVKGGHAHSTMLRKAVLIADALDCQLIAEVDPGALLAFANVAKGDGASTSDVDSFKNADMVLHVINNADSIPGYIAVEASFTVDGNDIRRAARNVGYLEKYTGLKSLAVVAGVDVLQDAQARIDRGEAHLYPIPRRELQPD